ncbi:MAG: Rpn family recombination-promoting nuclease/putative transposase [Bacteroidia bacterium]
MKARKHNRTEVPGGQMSNPHDRFFKHTFKDPQKVLGTLEGILSEGLYSRLRTERLRAVDTSYVDPKLRTYFSDLAYQCETQEGTPVHIAFLFEHKSYPVDYPHLQLLRYMLEIWDREVREQAPLSVVVPILVYHGREAWEYRMFGDYFGGDLSGLEGYVPGFGFEMLNLQASSFEEIGARFRQPSLRIAFRLMKAIRDEDIGSKVERIFEGVGELREEVLGYTFFQTLFVYLLHGAKTKDESIMRSMYNLIPEEWKEVEMFEDSPAMGLIERGRAEAWAEAWEKVSQAEEKVSQAEEKVSQAEEKVSQAEEKVSQAEEKVSQAEEKVSQAEEKVSQAEEKVSQAEEKAIAANQRAEAEARAKAEAIAALQKLETEKKTSIARMLDAGIERPAIAQFLGLSRQKLAAYIRQIRRQDED